MTVPVATSDLPIGRQILLGDIGLHSMTPEQMAKQGLADSAVMLSPEQIIGRVVSEPIKRDEPFMTTSVYLEGGRAPLSDVLSPGYRAVSLQIPDLRGGMTPPGTFVDVVFRSDAQTGRANPRVWIPEATVTLIESVEVIAVEKAPARNARSGNLDVRFLNGRGSGPPPLPTITLAVTLDDVNKLRTVEGRGDLTLVPRSSEEVEAELAKRANAEGGQAESTRQPAGVEPGTVDVVPDLVPPRPRRRPAMTLEGLLGVEADPEPFTTEIYRRGSRSVQVFGADGLLQEAKPSPGSITADVP